MTSKGCLPAKAAPVARVIRGTTPWALMTTYRDWEKFTHEWSREMAH